MIDIAILLALAPATSAAPTATAAPATDATEKMICKRQAVTGSLVSTKKVCMTRRDWNRTAEGSQKFGHDLVEGMRSRPGGN